MAMHGRGIPAPMSRQLIPVVTGAVVGLLISVVAFPLAVALVVIGGAVALVLQVRHSMSARVASLITIGLASGVAVYLILALVSSLGGDPSSGQDTS